MQRNGIDWAMGGMHIMDLRRRQPALDAGTSSGCAAKEAGDLLLVQLGHGRERYY